MLPKNWARRLKTNEAVQRMLCRLAVVVFAVLPVLYLITATIYWKSPGYAYQRTQAIANTISDACGVAVKVESVATLDRHRIQINNLELQHPETFEVLAKVELAVAERVGVQWIVHAPQIDCAVDKILAVSRVVHDRFLCRADDRLAKMQIVCDKVRPLNETSDATTGKLQIAFTPKVDRSSLQVSLQPKADNEKTIDLRFNRLRESAPLATTIELATNGFQIPVEYLSGVLGYVKFLGDKATFEGTLVYEQSVGEKWMMGKSLIRNFRWEQVTSALPYRLTGVGELYVDNLTLIDGKVTYAGGYVMATEGSINAEWLSKAQSMLGMEVRGGALNGVGVTKPFINMRAWFQLNQEGLLLKGGYNPPQEGLPRVVLWDADGPLMYEPAQLLNPLNAIQWVAARPAMRVAGPVAQASFESIDSSMEASPIAAYLMTTLPVSESIQR